MNNDSPKLRLTPFEHCMLADDRPSHPMSFFLRLEIEGVLDIARLKQAIGRNQHAHPFFFATVHRSRGKRFWNLDTVFPEITHHSAGEFSKSRGNWSIDLALQSGLRVSVSPAADHSEVWLQVHHSCSDARGTLDFAMDVLSAYERPHDGAGTEQHDRIPDDSAERTAALQSLTSEKNGPAKSGTYGCSASARHYWWPLSHHWRRIWAYYGHRSQPLLPRGTSATQSAPFRPAFLSRRIQFSACQWREQRRQHGHHATLNDGLLASVFRCLGRHFQQANGSQSRGWMRIGVPVDQRAAHGHCRSAVNRISMVFLDRHTRQICDKREFLSGISREMSLVRSKQLDCVWNDVLRVLDRLPGAMQLAARDRRCAVTAVVSNLGELHDWLARKIVNSLHEQNPASSSTKTRVLDFLVPLRRGTTMSIGLATFRDQLHLCIHYDARLLSELNAQRVLEDLSSDFSGFLQQTALPPS